MKYSLASKYSLCAFASSKWDWRVVKFLLFGWQLFTIVTGCITTVNGHRAFCPNIKAHHLYLHFNFPRHDIFRRNIQQHLTSIYLKQSKRRKTSHQLWQYCQVFAHLSTSLSCKDSFSVTRSSNRPKYFAYWTSSVSQLRPVVNSCLVIRVNFSPPPQFNRPKSFATDFTFIV